MATCFHRSHFSRRSARPVPSDDPVAAICGATYSAATTAFPAAENGNHLLAIGIMIGYFGMVNGVPSMAKWVNSRLVAGLSWLYQRTE